MAELPRSPLRATTRRNVPSDSVHLEVQSRLSELSLGRRPDLRRGMAGLPVRCVRDLRLLVFNRQVARAVVGEDRHRPRRARTGAARGKPCDDLVTRSTFADRRSSVAAGRGTNPLGNSSHGEFGPVVSSTSSAPAEDAGLRKQAPNSGAVRSEPPRRTAVRLSPDRRSG